MITDNDLSRLLGEVLAERGRITVPAAGFSMGRNFREADALVIEQLRGRVVRPGEVLVFRRFDRWVAHRVLRVFDALSPWLCLTQGDAVFSTDNPPVKKGEEVGVVTALVRGQRTHDLTKGWPQIAGRITAFVHRLLRIVTQASRL